MKQLLRSHPSSLPLSPTQPTENSEEPKNSSHLWVVNPTNVSELFARVAPRLAAPRDFGVLDTAEAPT
jgi:hypothetical protein